MQRSPSLMRLERSSRHVGERQRGEKDERDKNLANETHSALRVPRPPT